MGGFFSWYNVATNAGTGAGTALLAFYGISQGSTQFLAQHPQEETELVAANYYYSVYFFGAVAFVSILCIFAWFRSSYSPKSRSCLPSSAVVGLTQYLVKMSSERSIQGVMLLSAKVVGIVIYLSQAFLFWNPTIARPLMILAAIGVVFS